MSADPRCFCFEQPNEEMVFNKSVSKLMALLQESSRAALVSPQNVYSFHHGKEWVHSASEPMPDTLFHSISAEFVIPFKDIADNDLNLIARAILPLCEDMSRQFTQNIYRVVGAAAESVGNVVDAKAAGSIEASFFEMMSKIEFGVDRDGKVRLPQIHVGREAYEKLRETMENMSPEAATKFEQLKAQKSEEALRREAERKARFRSVKG